MMIFILAGATSVIGNLFLKSGMASLGDFKISLETIIPTFFSMIGKWKIIVGFFFYGLSSFLYLKLLATNDVTKIYPSLVGYMFFLLLLFGTIVLKESLTFVRVLGLGTIFLGIYLAAR